MTRLAVRAEVQARSRNPARFVCLNEGFSRAIGFRDSFLLLYGGALRTCLSVFLNRATVSCDYQTAILVLIAR